MAFINDFFGLVADSSVDLMKVTMQLTAKGLSLPNSLSNDAEKLCVASILYGQKTYTDAYSLDDVDIILKNGTYISIGKTTSTFTVGSEDLLNLNFVKVLLPSEYGAAKQRNTIASVISELNNAGYSFDLKIGGQNANLLELIATDKDGKTINVNEMLVKYGVCNYSDTGYDLGGTRQAKMNELKNEAIKHKAGIAGIKRDVSAAGSDAQNALKPFDNFQMMSKKNSKATSNDHLEAIFESEDIDGTMFKVGDVWLQIPPTNITISQMRNSYTVPLIGMESKPLSTPTNRTVIKVNVVFTGSQIYDDLIRILMQFRYCPINMIRSKDLFNRIAGSQSFLARDYSGLYYIPITMDQYTLFTVDGHPGTVSCVLQFSLFNYSAYVPDNTRGMEYYQYNDHLAILLSALKYGPLKTNNMDSLKTDLGIRKASTKEVQNTTETTWRLEEASHPYNTVIEDRINFIKNTMGEGDLFDMSNSNFQIWKIDMDKYFNRFSGLEAKEIDIDGEKNMADFLHTCVYSNPLFTEKAHSISVTYSNVFSWQPVLSQSHPVAQYIGPGETVLSVDLKAINMNEDYLDTPSGKKRIKSDQKMIGSLLKNWSEKYGASEYGFFDDRYFVRATLLNLIDANIVSIQNTVATSVESKPGLFDVNILFSKSMFEYNLRSNPVSMMDEYYGLQRMVHTYADDPDFKSLAKTINDKLGIAYSTLGDRLVPGVTLNGMSSGLRLAMDDILSGIKNDEKVYYSTKTQTKVYNQTNGGSTNKIAYAAQTKNGDYVVNTDKVYKALTITVNADSYEVLPSDNTDQAEFKAKYNAFGTLINEIMAAQKDNKAIPYGAVPPSFVATINGASVPLQENKEFMAAFFNLFLSSVGRRNGSYQQSGGTFTEAEQKKFVKNILEKEKTWYKALWDNESKAPSNESNHYHFVTKNAVVLQFDNFIVKDLAGNDPETIVIGTKTILTALDAKIKKLGGNRIIPGEWQQTDPNNKDKWYKVILLTGKGRNVPDRKVDDLTTNELSKTDNKKKMERIKAKAKAQAPLKPFASHRYYPFSEGFVGWSQFMSTTMGGWFVPETEEQSVLKINRMKEAARSAVPWNRDQRLYDPNCRQGAALAQNIPGMLQFVDTSNPLSAPAAIARPKMMRDMSAARDKDGVIADVQFHKKGTTLFGELFDEKNTTTNQVFNTVQDYLMYSDSNFDYKKQVDYVDYNGVSVKAEMKSQYLAQSAGYNEKQKELAQFEYDYLTNSIVNRNVECAQSQTGYFRYNDAVCSRMVLDNNRKWHGSVIVDGNKATPAGLVTGEILAKAGINDLNYSGDIKDSVMKASIPTMSINGSFAAARNGEFVRPGSPYINGKPLADSSDYKKIPDQVTMSGNNGSKSNIVTGEKITNILTTSHIESMQPTKGIENAFPTYKMYIIQSDTSDYKFSALDNYWDYRLVQDIMVVRDKDNPVHMLKARVVVDPRYVTIAPDYKFRTGVNGRLFHEEENHTQVPVRERNKEQDSNVFYKHKAPIRAGMRICIKMGYHTDPRYLDTVFIGTITQLNGSLDSGLYELSAEGDGRELTVPAVNFSDKFTGDNYSDIINAIMRVNPNVIHFGKTYGSFLRRLSYGHKTLAQLGMLGMSAVGAFGAGTVGVAVPGGIAAIAAKKTLAFSSPSLFKNIIGRGLGGGLVVAGAAGATLAATTVLPIAFGEFQQMGQWANPAFDELIARNIIETDFYQDWKGRTDKSLTVNLFGMTKDIPAIGELDGFIKGNTFNANKMSYQLTKHFYQTYKYGNNPLDDNIFAVDIFNSLTKRASLNITNKQSIWSVLQSIKMLYPNYALDIRPYGSRSTIFLGPVGFNYWRTDDPVQAILPQLNMMEGLEADAGLIDRETRRAFDANALPSTPMGDSIRNLDTKIKEGADDSRGALGLNRAPFVAFQKHHFITSDEDIIMNAIKPTPYRGWNSVIVTYGDDPNNMDPKKMVEFMADADLYPEAVIKRVIHIDFTTDPEVASRYALGFLKQGIEKLYGGTIIVKGNSKIEPYDKVYISDTVNKMYGWIQVETVIHKFDQEMGFTTHIVPNMICEINNNAYSTTQNIIMSTIYDKYIKKGAWSSVVGQFAIGGAVGLAIGAAGLSISLPVMFGLFAYQAYSAWSDYKSSFQAGKEYVGKMRDMVQADKWRNSEKILLQDIIAHSIELDAWQKGVKYGWALGYLHNRGYTKFLYKSEVTVGGMLNDSFHYFANKVKNSINMTRSALATNFGADSAVVKSWKAGQISAEAKAQMKRLAKGGSITAESTGLNEALLKETKGLWDDYHKNFKNALEKADFENAQGWLDSMKSLEEKHVTLKPEARIIPEDFDLVKKMEAAAAKAEGVQGGVASNLTKAVGKTTSAGFGGAKTVLEKIGRSGVAAWMTMGLMEFLPNLGYSFAVKAATKNNVIIVSPIYWRDNYLMPSLDGYMANDTFMHIGDMLLNVNNTLDDLNKAAHNYLPQVFPINSNIDKTTPLKGVQTVQAATSEEMNKAGELVFCILRNSGLPEIPKDFSETKWTYIAQYVKAYQVIGGANMAIFLLALLYTENRFSISGTSKKGAYGMSQIVTPGPYDRLLAKNASQTLGQTISSEMRSKLANGNFVDALQCKGYTESTLPAFINFNIKSAADISNDKWNSAYNTFYKDPNSRISKARKASTQGDVMDAVLLYGAYCGYGYNFVNDMLTGDYIKSDGTVNQSPAQKSKGFANYSSQEAIWKNNGFLSAYLALRAAYLKCSANDQNQAQKPQAKGTAVDTSMKALKQKIADYATSRVGKAFNPSNGDTSKGRAPQNRNKQNVTIDCSMFVGYVVETSTMKDRDDGRINKAIDAIIGTGRGYSSCAIMYAAGGQYTEIANAMPGDLVFFRKNSGGPVTHVEVVSRYDTSTQKWLSIGTSDAAGMIKERPISRTGFDQYEVRSYFN